MEDSEITDKSQDSYFKKDFDKLKEMLHNLKEVTLSMVSQS